MYHAVLNSDFDLGEIPTYEDVELLPPNSIHKRPLVLIGNLIIEEFVNIKYRKVVDIKCTVGKKNLTKSIKCTILVNPFASFVYKS